MTPVAFQQILRKQIRKLPNILKFVKIIQSHSILFNRVLGDVHLHRHERADPGAVGVAHRGADAHPDAGAHRRADVPRRPVRRFGER